MRNIIFLILLLTLGAQAGTNRTIETKAIRNGSVTFTLPTNNGSSGDALTNNGSGTLSWSTIASGATTVGSYDSQTPSANALVISGSTIYAQSASATNPGGVSTGTQTFGGTKTFSTLNFTSGIQKSGAAFIGVTNTGGTYVGLSPNSDTSGNYNTDFGFNSCGVGNAPSGGLNTCFGAQALQHLTTGANNVSMGVNTCASVLSGTSNTCIGYGSDIQNDPTGAVAIGSNAIAAASGAFMMGDGNVNVGIGNVNSGSPLARLHLPAGTASANKAPLKLTSGTSMTNAEDGAIEYDGTHFYMTDSAPKRRTIMGSLGTNTAFVSAEVSVTGTVSSESGDWITSNCALAASVFTCTLVSGVFSAAPKCVASINGTSSGDVSVAPASATSVLVYTFAGTTGIAADRAFTLMCHGAN